MTSVSAQSLMNDVFYVQHVPDQGQPAARAVLRPDSVLPAEEQTLPRHPGEFPPHRVLPSIRP